MFIYSKDEHGLANSRSWVIDKLRVILLNDIEVLESWQRNVSTLNMEENLASKYYDI